MTNQINKNFQDNFLDELILEAGFTTQDNLDVLKEELRPVLWTKITKSIYSQLDQEQKDTVTELLDDGKLDELNQYLEEIIPDFQEKMVEVYADFEEEYLENMEA